MLVWSNFSVFQSWGWFRISNASICFESKLLGCYACFTVYKTVELAVFVMPDCWIKHVFQTLRWENFGGTSFFFSPRKSQNMLYSHCETKPKSPRGICQSWMAVRYLWILFRHDFWVGLSFSPLSPFYWILFRHDFQVCLPLSPFYWILFRHDFQVCLPLSPFYWILFRHAFQVCLPLSSLYWILLRRDFQASLHVYPFYWIQFHPMSSRFPDFSRCVSPFVSLLLDPVPSWFRGLSPRASPFVFLLLDSVSLWFPGLFPFVSLLLDRVSSCFPAHWFGCLSPFGSLLNSLHEDPYLLWFGGVFYFVFPIFLAGTWFKIKIVKLVRMWEAVWGRCWCIFF